VADADDIRKSVGLGALAFGAVATLTPRVFAGLYGLPNEPNVRAMTRTWGTRTAVLGAMALMLQRPEDQRRLMTLAAAMNAADSVLVAGSSGLSKRTRVLGSLSSAGFAAALGYGVRQ
jgi:hypothetical protein